MTTTIKKLLLTLVTAVLGVMSGGVIAQTSYNFDYTYTSDTPAEMHATIVVDADYTVTNMIGTIDFMFTGVQIIQGASGGPFGPTAPWGGGYSIFFSTPTENFELYYDGTRGGGEYNLTNQTSGYASFAAPSNVIVSCLSGCAAVPEIDGALIPQVGLLLAGLFIILGRRKENTEPLLAV